MTLYNQIFKKVLASKFAMILMFLAGYAAISSAQATADITIDDFTIGYGDTYKVEVKLKSSELVINPQFDVVLPAGLYIWNDAEKGDLLNRNHSLQMVNQGSNTYRFVITSTTNKPLNATEGVLVSFEIRSWKIFEGTVDIKNKSMKTATLPRQDIYPADSKTKVKSEALINGVTNFSVNPEKVNVIVDEQFDVNVILENDWDNVDMICGLEADLTLPEGISLVEDADGNIGYTDRIPDGVTIDATQTEAGKYKIVMTSLTNKPIEGTSGALFVLRMKASEAFGTSGEVVVSNIVLAANNGAGRYVEEPLKVLLVNKAKAAAAKDELKAAIETAKATETEGMTEESVKALTDAIAAGEAALADAFAPAETLAAAKIAIENAIAGLRVQPILPDGKYFIQNIVSSKFWGAANDWGTRASLVKNPEYVTLLAQPDGKYFLESQVSNGGTSYYFGGDYMDGQPVALTITKIEEPFGYKDEAETIPVYAYTIADAEGKFFGFDGTSTILGKDIAADSENILWLIASEEEAYEALSTATVDDPVDATFLITDHTFGRNHRNVSAWTNEGGAALTGGNSNKHTAEKYHGVFNVYQKLEKAPAGIYKFTAQGFYRQDGSDEENLPVFYANDVTSTFPLKTGNENSMADACASFESGLYAAEPIYVQVTEAGELTVGAKVETNTTLWCIWDNFELTYYGANANLDEVKNASAKEEMNELVEKAQELLAEAKNEAVKAQLETAIATAATANTAETIAAAIELLKNAVDGAEASVIAAEKLPKMKELIDATNVYTEEAYNEYYGKWVAKYEDGSLTKAEASALQDPFLVTGWHANITVDNFLLSAWDTNPDFNNAPYYINSWSVEGDNDGSNFRVPFFEYWTGDDSSLGERTLTATMNNLEAGNYEVSALVRVRAKNGYEAPAYGIALQANDGEAVNVAAGDQIAESQFYMGEFKASGVVAEDGVLKIKFNIAADNNISWLSFKNVKFEKKIVVNPDDPEIAVADGWHSVIANGNLASDDVANFFSKENGGNPVPSTIVAGAGKNNSRGIVINTPDNPSQDWDAQFFIQANENIPAGYKIHVEFDYMATQEAGFDTQSHAEPGNYIHWYCVDSYTAKPEWQHMSKEVEVSAADASGNGEWGKACTNEANGKPFKTVAFNLSKVKTATTFYFDNIVFWVSNVATGIHEVKSENNNEGIFNLNGQKVQKAQKGIYIINGKKVNLK